MADNLSVNVTADTTSLRAQLALATQDMKTHAAGMRSAAADIRATGVATDEQTAALRKNAEAYNEASARASGYRAALRKVDTAHASVAHSGGVMREVLVMGHETLMGNYTRLGGSVMVLAERTNALGAAMSAMSGPIGVAVAGAAALTAGLAFLAIRAHEAAMALREVGTEAVLQGRSGPQAVAATKAMADSLENTGIVGSRAAIQIAAAVEQLPRVTEEQRAKINALAPGFFLAFSEDAEKTTKQIGEIFASDTSLKAYVDKYQLLSTDQMQAWASATTSAEKYEIGIAAISARLDPAVAKYKELKQAADDWRGQEMATGALGTPALPMPGMAPPKPALPPTGLGDVDPGTNAPSPADAEKTENLIKYTGELRQQAELTRALKLAQDSLAEAQSAGNAKAIAMAQAAIDKIKAEQAALKSPGDADWSSKVALQAEEAGNAAVVAAREAHAQRLQITEAGLRAELAVYQQAAQDTSRTEAERTAMKRRAIDIEMSLAKDEASGETTAAKQAYEAKVATFDQEIAAARGNTAQIIALEKQKLDYIKAAHGEASADFQRALKEEDGALTASVSEQVKKIEEGAKQEVAAKAASLQDQVSLRQMSKVQEEEALLQFQQTEQASELQSLQTLIDTQGLSVRAYQDATDAKAKAMQQFAIDNQKLQDQIDQANQQAAEKMVQPYTQAFSQIGSSAERAFAGYLTYSTTWQRAEQQIARSVLESFVNMAMTMVERWAVAELAMNTSTAAGTAVRNAQEQSSSTTGFGTLIAAWTAKETTQTGITAAAGTARAGTQAAADSTANAATITTWTGLETSKTAETTAGATARAGAETSSGFFGAVGSMLAGWLGLETSKTAATTAGSAVRTAAQATADETALATALANNVTEAMSYAAVGGVAAGSSVAAIPIVGWAMAPGVAAETYGVLSGFAAMASFDVGTDYVPHDMLAQVHRGEMVVPQTFADSIRSGDISLGGGGDSGGGGSGGHSFTYAPTFHGAGADLARQARREFDGFSSRVMDMFRNGQTRLPGRA